MSADRRSAHQCQVIVMTGRAATRHRRDMEENSLINIKGWGKTVNPLAYAFVGSSPTSPTIRRTEGGRQRTEISRTGIRRLPSDLRRPVARV